jgi:large subunit ribosomal protein L24
MKLHTGDIVVITAGKDKGKTGRILRVLMEKNRVVVAGANMRTRHIKKTPQSPGRVVRYEAAIHASNVMLIDSKTKKRTRIGYRTSDGKRERFAKKSGEAILSGRKLRALVEEEGGAGEEKGIEGEEGTEGVKAGEEKKKGLFTRRQK